jgi:hypothetical protein
MKHFEVRVIIHTDDNLTWDDVEWGMINMISADDKTTNPLFVSLGSITSIIAEEFTQEGKLQ